MADDNEPVRETMLKIQRFSGKDEDFALWRMQFRNAMTQRGLGYLFEENLDVPFYNADEAGLTDIQLRNKRGNQRGMGLLLGSGFDTLDDAGERAHGIAARTVRPKKHMMYGNFPAAWRGLDVVCGSIGMATKATLKQQYSDMMMKHREHPGQFINRLVTLRLKLEDDFDVEIEDADFLMDIVSKLPVPNNPERQVDIYQLEKAEIEKSVEEDEGNGELMTLNEAQLKLTQRYDVVYPKNKKRKGRGSSDEYGLNASQVKVRCRNCGQWGHKSYNCPEKKNSGNGSGKDGKGKQPHRNRTCHFCKKKGHIAKNCPEKARRNGAGNNGGSSETANSSYDVVLMALEDSPIYCSECGSSSVPPVDVDCGDTLWFPPNRFDGKHFYYDPDCDGVESIHDHSCSDGSAHGRDDEDTLGPDDAFAADPFDAFFDDFSQGTVDQSSEEGTGDFEKYFSSTEVQQGFLSLSPEVLRTLEEEAHLES